MNRDRIIAAAAAAAVAAGVLVSLSDSDLGAAPQDGRAERPQESKLVELPDAGKGYAYPATLPDGGTEYVVTDVAPCVRARADAGMCWRVDEDGGARFFGWDNRFQREDMHPSSSLCQPVACSIVAGENAEEDEDVRLGQLKDGG